MEQQNHESALAHQLERYLIEHQGYDDYDAWLRVSYDYVTVKKEYTYFHTDLTQTV
jgi:hypothetical protein